MLFENVQLNVYVHLVKEFCSSDEGYFFTLTRK